MKKQRLGQSDIYITPLTLGGMSLGKDKQKASDMIDEALYHGINHIDTADLYDFGENEHIIGETIKKKRHDIILTSKVGNHFNKEKKEWFWDPSPTYIHQAIDASLKRLQTDYLDLYLLHGGTIEDPIDDIIETFERLKEKGKIRSYGISSIRPNVIDAYVHRSNIDAIMMQYNILDRRPEELFAKIAEKDIHVLARGPFAKGILSDQAMKQIAKKANEGYLSYSYEQLKEILASISSLYESNIATIALQYVLQQDVVRSAVFGASSMEQLNKNIAAFTSEKLSPNIYKQLQSITKQLVYEQHRL
ncbi:aldo/keto reductase [Pseudogracilibacillus sp. ICA-222130]|uniref:aldo/keto reductase n=1 Tax=Pseudogracilibacillus sp. ICA-222130 TaxID=3134655 RepID=UPI0030C16D0F